jgi:hypothetical protein
VEMMLADGSGATVESLRLWAVRCWLAVVPGSSASCAILLHDLVRIEWQGWQGRGRDSMLSNASQYSPSWSWCNVCLGFFLQVCHFVDMRLALHLRVFMSVAYLLGCLCTLSICIVYCMLLVYTVCSRAQAALLSTPRVWRWFSVCVLTVPIDPNTRGSTCTDKSCHLCRRWASSFLCSVIARPEPLRVRSSLQCT